MSTLTQKQVRFALDIIKEVPPGKAYMEQYKVSTMAVADSAASRMLKTVKIQDYLTQLRAEVKSAAIMDFAERQERLTTIARQSAKTCAICGNSHIGAERNGIASIAEINKMDGAYAPEKHAHIILKGELTDDELLAIAGGFSSRGGNGASEKASGT